jgi:protein-disulfide isomerase
MPSGKKSKQQRRATATAVRTPPPVRSKGVGARPRQASPRALAIGAAVVAIAAIAIVLAVVLGRGSSSGIPSGTPTVGTLQGALPGASDIADLYRGIPQKGLTLGKPSAPVRMVIYIDVQCPICQAYEVESMPTIVNHYVRPGKLSIELKPWAFIGPDSFTGRLALIAASYQNRAFDYAGVLYDNQQPENTGWVTDAMLAQIAASVPGLDVKQLFSDRNDSQTKSIAKDVDAQAAKDKVKGTPTVLIGKRGATPKDVTTPGAAPTLEETTSAIDAALGQ